MNKKILIINRYFYPGYKAGGPIQSLKNICDALQNNFDISVLTFDRDYLDKNSYKGINLGRWNKFQNYKIFYAKDKLINKPIIEKAIKEINPDLIYLNSFFDKISINSIKVARKKSIPIVLAPRGEFSTGALKLKKIKKNIFLKISKFIGLYENITYHATNEFEAKDIEYTIGAAPMFISENLVKKPYKRIISKYYGDEIRFVYISRITPKKNILFFLEFLSTLDIDKKIVFNIYGPIGDKVYWIKCLKVISNIDNTLIKVNYLGSMPPNKFEGIYNETHFSILPTLGENFGHSIYESLAHGVPVIISDQTPWRNLENKKAGFDLKLTSPEFEKIFNKINDMNAKEYLSYCDGALYLSNEYCKSLDIKKLKESFTRVMR
jgi:glycosyltransferase involved in cell wall biosynthesis